MKEEGWPLDTDMHLKGYSDSAAILHVFLVSLLEAIGN